MIPRTSDTSRIAFDTKVEPLFVIIIVGGYASLFMISTINFAVLTGVRVDIE